MNEITSEQFEKFLKVVKYFINNNHNIEFASTVFVNEEWYLFDVVKEMKEYELMTIENLDECKGYYYDISITDKAKDLFSILLL